MICLGGGQCGWLRHHAVSRKVAVSIRDKFSGFLIWSESSNSTMTLRLTQPPTEMSTRNLPGSEGRPVHKVDNFTAICELIV
jgi:hypothetical protein